MQEHHHKAAHAWEPQGSILLSASCGGFAFYSLPYSYVMFPLLNQERAGIDRSNSSSLELMATGDGAWIGTPPPAVTCGALKAPRNWPVVISALAADICSSFSTVSVTGIPLDGTHPDVPK